jgi:hypothetical protein
MFCRRMLESLSWDWLDIYGKYVGAHSETSVTRIFSNDKVNGSGQN